MRKVAEVCIVKALVYLLIFLELCVVDLSDLGEFGSVVGMFNGVVSGPTGGHSGSCGSCRTTTFFWPSHTLC